MLSHSASGMRSFEQLPREEAPARRQPPPVPEGPPAQANAQVPASKLERRVQELLVRERRMSREMEDVREQMESHARELRELREIQGSRDPSPQAYAPPMVGREMSQPPGSDDYGPRPPGPLGPPGPVGPHGPLRPPRNLGYTPKKFDPQRPAPDQTLTQEELRRGRQTRGVAKLPPEKAAAAQMDEGSRGRLCICC